MVIVYIRRLELAKGGMKNINLELEPDVHISAQCKEVVWNSTGEKLAVGLWVPSPDSHEAHILVWDVYKNTQMRILADIDGGWIYSVMWDPTDNDTLASFIQHSNIWKIQIWNAKYNNDLKSTIALNVNEPDYRISFQSIKWAPNGEFFLLSGLWCEDGSAWFWDHGKDDNSFYGVLKWNKCTNYTEKILLFKKKMGHTRSTHSFMEFSPDSQVIACGLTKCGYIDLVNTYNGEIITTIHCERGEPENISWSNGDMLVTCGNGSSSSSPSVKIWSVLTQKKICLIESHPSYLGMWYTSIKWNRINNMLAVATVNPDTDELKGKVTIWHAPKGIICYKQLISFEVYNGVILGNAYVRPFPLHLAWNPVDATALAIAGGNKIQVWEVLPTVTVTDVMQREWRRSSALFCLLTY